MTAGAHAAGVRSNPSARLHFWLAATTLLLAIVLGGGRGSLGDTATQLSALALLVAVGWRQASDDTGLPTLAWLAALPLVLPLIQLLPLPADWLPATMARSELATELGAIGLSLPAGIALFPSATERALHWLLPAVALYLATLQMSSADRRRLLALLMVAATAAVVVGIAQMFGGPESALRFHDSRNATGAVGFFVNRNHYASQLAMALPLVLVATAWAVSRRLDGRRVHGGWIAAGILLGVLLILGIALARSRAGLLLGMLAIALSVPAMLSLRQRRGGRRVIAAIVAIGLLLSVQYALVGILERLEKDPADDLRWVIAPITLQAAEAHAPLGAGLGSFWYAYQPFEGDTVGAAIVNHAHNDYFELWLDGGWLAVLLLAPLLLAFLHAGWRVWRRQSQPSEAMLIARAAWIALLLALLHSTVDYPLRTTANLAVAGMLAALVLSPRRPDSAAR
ncbi:MAG TPA: O-antigen ligase family protein [Arenimonas sp.]|nr:O-antigen ligase family protein [Arenimonas sp.]